LTENSSEKEVSEDTMSKAVELAKDFIIPAYRRTYGNIEIGSNIEIDIWVIGFILKKSSSDKTISLREVFKFFIVINISYKFLPVQNFSGLA
jgi:bifunctional DNA-binding transcriptional regulator/antitoxin component of YhaV-PrlF toxin-antitoxin module